VTKREITCENNGLKFYHPMHISAKQSRTNSDNGYNIFCLFSIHLAGLLHWLAMAISFIVYLQLKCSMYTSVYKERKIQGIHQIKGKLVMFLAE
jgi:hypothetical protein